MTRTVTVTRRILLTVTRAMFSEISVSVDTALLFPAWKPQKAIQETRGQLEEEEQLSDLLSMSSPPTSYYRDAVSTRSH